MIHHFEFFNSSSSKFLHPKLTRICWDTKLTLGLLFLKHLEPKFAILSHFKKKSLDKQFLLLKVTRIYQNTKNAPVFPFLSQNRIKMWRFAVLRTFAIENYGIDSPSWPRNSLIRMFLKTKLIGSTFDRNKKKFHNHTRWNTYFWKYVQNNIRVARELLKKNVT